MRPDPLVVLHRSVGAETGGQLDLDGNVEGQFGQSHRAPGMAAGLTKTSTSKSEHPSMTAILVETGPDAGDTEDLDDAIDAVEIASPNQRGQDRGRSSGPIPPLFE